MADAQYELLVKISAQIDELVAGIQESKSQIESLRSSVESFTGTLENLAVATGAAFVVDKIVEYGREFGDMGEEIERTSVRLGTSVEETQELTGTLQALGVSTSGSAGSFNLFERNLSNAAETGRGRAVDAFDKLGVSIIGSNGSVKTMTELLPTLADSFQAMPDGIEKTNLAITLFGRYLGPALLPYLNQGAAGIEEYMQKVRDVGGVLDEAGVKKLAQLAESFHFFDLAVTGAGENLVVGFAPALKEVIDGLTNLIAEVGKSAAFQQFAEGIGAALHDIAEKIKEIKPEDVTNALNLMKDALGYVKIAIEAWLGLLAVEKLIEIANRVLAIAAAFNSVATAANLSKTAIAEAFAAAGAAETTAGAAGTLATGAIATGGLAAGVGAALLADQIAKARAANISEIDMLQSIIDAGEKAKQFPGQRFKDLMGQLVGPTELEAAQQRMTELRDVAESKRAQAPTPEDVTEQDAALDRLHAKYGTVTASSDQAATSLGKVATAEGEVGPPAPPPPTAPPGAQDVLTALRTGAAVPAGYAGTEQAVITAAKEQSDAVIAEKQRQYLRGEISSQQETSAIKAQLTQQTQDTLAMLTDRAAKVAANSTERVNLEAQAEGATAKLGKELAAEDALNLKQRGQEASASAEARLRVEQATTQTIVANARTAYAATSAAEKQRFESGAEDATTYFNNLRTASEKERDTEVSALQHEIDAVHANYAARIAAAHGNATEITKLKGAEAAEVIRLEGQVTSAYARDKRQQIQITEQAGAEEVRIAKETASAAIAAAGQREQATLKQADFERQMSGSGITADLQAMQVKLAAVDRYTAEYTEAAQNRVMADLQADRLSEDAARKETDDLVRMQQRSAEKRVEIEQQAALQIRQHFIATADAILAPFNSAIDGLIRGTETWQQAFGNILENLLMQFISFIERLIVEWAAKQLGLAVIDKTGALQTMALAIATGFGQIEVAAGVAAANAAAAAAGGGPGAMALAAGEAYATTLGFAEGLGAGGMIAVAGAQTGMWAVPGNLLTYLHAGEMVIPQNFAEGLRSGGGGGFGGGGGAVGVTFNINTLDARGVSALLKQQGGAIAQAIATQVRNASNHLRTSARSSAGPYG